MVKLFFPISLLSANCFFIIFVNFGGSYSSVHLPSNSNIIGGATSTPDCYMDTTGNCTLPPSTSCPSVKCIKDPTTKAYDCPKGLYSYVKNRESYPVATTVYFPSGGTFTKKKDTGEVFCFTSTQCGPTCEFWVLWNDFYCANGTAFQTGSFKTSETDSNSALCP